MNLYEVDIHDTKTGNTKRCQMVTGWTDDGSLTMWRTKMCDCNLGGYFERLVTRDPQTGEHRYSAHEFSAWQFRGCDHSMPPKRFVAQKAYLSDGRVIDLRTGNQLTKAA